MLILDVVVLVEQYFAQNDDFFTYYEDLSEDIILTYNQTFALCFSVSLLY